MIKTNSSGSKLWEKTLGGSGYDSGSSVQQTSDGGYIIAGSTTSYGAGSSDVYLVKLETNAVNLTATNNWDGKTISLSWSSDAGSVKIYRKKESGSFEYITTVSSSSYTNTVPEPGKNYTYVLKNTSGSQISNEATVKAEVVIVLVRGYSLTGDGNDPDSWKSNQDEQSKGLVPDVKQWFENRGLICWDASSQLNGKKDIEWNSNTLKNFIANLRVGSYANAKVNLVAHSMGGLTSRRYANENEGIVSNIFCIQTPHTGSPLADLVGWFVSEARADLQYNFLEVFNKDYLVKSSTNVYSFYSDNWTNVLDKFIYEIANSIIKADIRFSYNGEQSDGVVPYLSAQGQRYKKYTYGNPNYGTYYEIWQLTTDVWPMAGTIDIDFDHSTGHRHPDTLNKILEWLGLPHDESLNIMPMMLEAEPKQEENLPFYYVAGYVGQLDSSTPASHVASIGNSTKALFRATVSDVNCFFTLLDPCGVTYDPCYAVSEPNVTYEAEDDGIFCYEVNSPISGVWTLNLSATIAPPNSVDYGLTVFESENIALSLYSYPCWANTDANILILATLTQNDNPLIDANIVADIILPDTNSISLVLFDDGLHGDVNDADGTYANTFISTNQVGTYNGQIRATGLSALGTNFERNSSLTFTVSAPDVNFAGDINDVGIDLNANGLYDILRFTIPVYVDERGSLGDLNKDTLVDFNDLAQMTNYWLNSGCETLNDCNHTDLDKSGSVDFYDFSMFATYWLFECFSQSHEYSLSAKLFDSNDNLIKLLTTGSLNLPTGHNILILNVKAEDIVRHNVNGPYTLSNITVSDANTGLIIAATNDYNTAAYLVSAFEPLDTDGDGLSDNFERSIGSDPNLSDSDFDGVSDYNEVSYDGDANSYNPATDLNPTNADTDGDGMSDGWEIRFGYNPLSDDGTKNNDDDNDGLTNLEEFQKSTLPNNFDTDGDGIGDGDEVNVYNTNPANADTDSDGLSDGGEVECGTDPTNPDTDGDTILDGTDNCKLTPNLDQNDLDADGLGDICDNCPNDPYNDIDNDGICGDVDNCPFVYNPDQKDTDGDGYGDACECEGANLNGIDPVDFTDFAILAQDWMKTGSGLAGDVSRNGIVDIEDLSKLVTYWLCNCPP